jgi:hypothetical protein
MQVWNWLKQVGTRSNHTAHRSDEECVVVTAWPRKPFIYQINTWVWLNELSRKYRKPITLESVPDEVLNDLAALQVDAIWLMGIWTRSAAARQSALRYTHEYKPALPDLKQDDVVGSAYAVGSYQVDEWLGGRYGLAAFRKRLAAHGLKLLLDYVPNHVATDHAWVGVHTDRMLLGTPKLLEQRPDDFFSTRDAMGKKLVVAHGRDPHFSGWIDTAQINAFSPSARRAALNTLLDIASQCDGVRCDMAMLMLNEVFSRTWNGVVGAAPTTEYWAEIIPHVKEAHPEFLFIAEVYWDMEYRLHGLGFDYCYDKRLYDRLREGHNGDARMHLIADLKYQSKLVRFIENHDEARATTAFGVQRSRPAAVLVCTLPGATLLHDGQFSARKVKLPVQIGRAPDEAPDQTLMAFYRRLLTETRSPIYQHGNWRLFEVNPGHHDGSHHNLIAYGWHGEGDDFRLIVVNVSGVQSRGHVSLWAWTLIDSEAWVLHDVMDDSRYTRPGHSLHSPGLYVDLAPYQSHVFRINRYAAVGAD